MMYEVRAFEFRCDGCGAALQLFRRGPPEAPPPGWAHVRQDGRSRDLCPACVPTQPPHPTTTP